jgi:hypothetical protein
VGTISLFIPTDHDERGPRLKGCPALARKRVSHPLLITAQSLTRTKHSVWTRYIDWLGRIIVVCFDAGYEVLRGSRSLGKKLI